MTERKEKKINIENISLSEYNELYVSGKVRISCLERTNNKLYLELVKLTFFLTANATVAQRLWHVNNDMYKLHTCIECDSITPWVGYKKNYNLHCDRCYKILGILNERRNTNSILNSGLSIKEKIIKTNLERYGVEYGLKTPQVREKIIKTNLERYGVENVSQNAEIREKIIKTNLERYGVENVSQNAEINEKRKETFIERFGTSSPLANKEIIKKRHTTNIERYGYINPLNNEDVKSKTIDTLFERYHVDNIFQVPEIKEKIKIYNRENYGVDYTSQRSDIKEKTKKTIELKYNNVPLARLKNTDDVNEKLLNNEWLLEQHITNKKSLTEIAIELGYSVSGISTIFKQRKLHVNNYYESIPEKDIKYLLHSKNIIFESNTKKIITPYELDIYIPSKNIAIEYCGLYWHSEAEKTDKNYHKNKLDMCATRNIRLITIFEDEWVHNRNLVLGKLKNILHIDDSERVYARNTKVIKVTKNQKKTFLNENHIQGNCDSTIDFGLIANNNIVAVMSFLKVKNIFLLNRYATSKNIIGGFSKLLKHFEKEYNTPEIHTFADLRWSNGDLYKNNGFTATKKLYPDYSYVDLTKIIRIHKFLFRHKALPKKIKQYDRNLSEHDNTLNNKIYRIYDCGKIKFIKNYL